MENFKVEDMKVGDSFEWTLTSNPSRVYTTTRISDLVYRTEWINILGFKETWDTTDITRYKSSDYFKLLKVDFKNTFTKSDLISGEHIVETAEGFRYLVAGNYLIGVKGYNTLTNSYKEDLKHKNYACLDIVKVFIGGDGNYIYAGEGFEDYLKNEKLKLIYDRQENEHRASQQAKLRSLEESIAEQQKKAEKLREELGL